MDIRQAGMKQGRLCALQLAWIGKCHGAYHRYAKYCKINNNILYLEYVKIIYNNQIERRPKWLTRDCP